MDRCPICNRIIALANPMECNGVRFCGLESCHNTLRAPTFCSRCTERTQLADPGRLLVDNGFGFDVIEIPGSSCKECHSRLVIRVRYIFHVPVLALDVWRAKFLCKKRFLYDDESRLMIRRVVLDGKRTMRDVGSPQWYVIWHAVFWASATYLIIVVLLGLLVVPTALSANKSMSDVFVVTCQAGIATAFTIIAYLLKKRSGVSLVSVADSYV